MRCLFLWCLALLAAVAPSEAAEIRLLGTTRVDGVLTTQLSLSGPIARGDADKIDAGLKDAGFNTTRDGAYIGRAVLYLDSPGGNFAEGVAIAKRLRSSIVATVIRKDARCLSACAIAFLGGTELGGEEVRLVSRTVEIGGVLGFHAPFLDVPRGQYDKPTVDRTYAVAVSSIADLIKLAESIGVSTDVLPEVLETGTGQFKFIQTVDDFARFNIGIAPQPKIPHVTETMVKNVCRNKLVWTKTKYPTDGEDFLVQAGFAPKPLLNTISVKSFTGAPAMRTIVATGNAGEGIVQWCLFDWSTDDGRLFSWCRGYIEVVSDQWGAVVQKARDFDKGGESGTPAISCDFSVSDVVAMAPASTNVKDLQSTLNAMLTREKPLRGGSTASGQSQVSGFTQNPNLDADGRDLQVLRNTSSRACRTSCAALGRCVGATYDRWNRVCILKSRISALAINAKSSVWLRNDVQVRQRNTSPSMLKRNRRAFPDGPYRTVPLRSFERCANACLREARCMAVNFRRSGRCELIDNASEYQRHRSTTIGFKVQN